MTHGLLQHHASFVAMPALDSHDLAILQAMRVYPFNGAPHGPDALRPAPLAERTGLSIDLVKDRVMRMERDGIIAGYQVYPNLHHLGLHETVLHIVVPLEARERFFSEADQMDGVAGLSRFVGESACIDLTYASTEDLRRKSDDLMALAGHEDEPDRYVQLGATEPTGPLGNLDWRIIQAMRGDAKRPYKEVAKLVGVNTRTVRRRLQRMDDDNAIDVVVEPDLGAVNGAIMLVACVSCIQGATEATFSQVMAEMRHRSFSSLQPATRDFATFMVDGFAFSQREVDEMRSAVAAVPGVQGVELLYPSSATASSRWLDDAIDAMVAKTSKDGTNGRRARKVEIAN